jgi:V/A-type H+-transporting ATPase subunit A
VDPDWEKRRATALALLARDAELSRIVNLVGPEALSDAQRWELEGASLVKEGVLQQSALDDVDTFCSPQKQYALLDLAITIYKRGAALIDIGVPVSELQTLPILAKMRRLKSMYTSEQMEQIQGFRVEVNSSMEAIRMEYAKQGERA